MNSEPLSQWHMGHQSGPIGLTSGLHKQGVGLTRTHSGVFCDSVRDKQGLLADKSMWKGFPRGRKYEKNGLTLVHAAQRYIH